MHTPASVHHGTHTAVRAQRAATLQAAYQANPARFGNRRPKVERAFWLRIAEGLTSEDAAIACGVSGPVGSRWFRGAWRHGLDPAVDVLGQASVVR